MSPNPGLIPSLPEPWASFLGNVDKLLNSPIKLQCLGGFVLTVMHGLPRVTGDIDSLTVIPRQKFDTLMDIGGPESKLAKKYRICFHYVGVAEVPEDYEQRLVQMFPGRFSNLRLFALELHDLVLAKLTRNSPVDIEDVRFLAKKKALDPGTLRNRYENELRPRLPNQERHDLTLQLWLSYFENGGSRQGLNNTG